MLFASQADGFRAISAPRAKSGALPKVQEFFALGDLKLPKLPAATGRNPGLRPGVQPCPSPTAEADWGQLLVTVPVSLPLGPGWRKSHGDSELRELHRRSARRFRRRIPTVGASRPESNGMCKLRQVCRQWAARTGSDGGCQCVNFTPAPARPPAIGWRVSICQLHPCAGPAAATRHGEREHWDLSRRRARS